MHATHTIGEGTGGDNAARVTRSWRPSLSPFTNPPFGLVAPARPVRPLLLAALGFAAEFLALAAVVLTIFGWGVLLWAMQQ